MADADVRLVNLCPHALTIQLQDRQIVLPAEKESARVATQRVPADAVAGVPVSRVLNLETTGLPAPVQGTFYVVSMVVYQANPARADLLCPDTSPEGAVRDEKGQIVAVRGFATY